MGIGYANPYVGGYVGTEFIPAAGQTLTVKDTLYDRANFTTTITSVDFSYNNGNPYYTITLAGTFGGTTGLYSNTFFRFTKTYTTYTLDPETSVWPEDWTHSGGRGYAYPQLGDAYSYWIPVENRWVSSGFFTVSPQYTIKKLDGTLIGTFNDTSLIESVLTSTDTTANNQLFNTSTSSIINNYSIQGFSSSPSSMVWKSYNAAEIGGTSWFTTATAATARYNTQQKFKSAKIRRDKLMEFYYTYGPCIIELKADILIRTMTTGRSQSQRHPYTYPYSTVTGSVAETYTSNTYSDIIRFKIQETVVPINTPPLNIIRPSSLIGFSTAPADYKISFSAARLTNRYKDSKKILIESINPSTNLITITNHGFKQFQLVRYVSSGTVATGLKDNNYYYVILNGSDPNSFYLAKDYYYTSGVLQGKLDVKTTGSPGSQYICIDSSNYTFNTNLSNVNDTTDTVYFATQHGLNTGDRVQYLAPQYVVATNVTNLVHYSYYYVSKIDNSSIKLLDVTGSPVNITKNYSFAIPTLTFSTQTSRTGWTVTKNYNSNTTTLSINIQGNYSAATVSFDVIYNISVSTATNYSWNSVITGSTGGMYYGSGASIGTTQLFGKTITTTSGRANASGTGSLTVGNSTLKVGFISGYYGDSQTNSYTFNITFSNPVAGAISFVKFPDVIQEISDKNVGYIGLGTETNLLNAAPTRTLSSLTGNNLTVKLYRNKIKGGLVNSINIPVLTNKSNSNTVTIANSTSLYGLTEVAFMPGGSDIKHYSAPLVTTNNYTQYNKSFDKLNNSAAYTTTVGDFIISSQGSISDSTGSPANAIFATHGLTTGSPIRISTANQNTINTTNYNAITKVKISSLISGDIGSLFGTTSAHNYKNGDIVVYQQCKSVGKFENLLDVLRPGQRYYVIVVDYYWFKLAESLQKAQANKGIILNSFGTFAGEIINGIDTTTATIYFKYPQTSAANAVSYNKPSYTTKENPISVIYNDSNYDKTTGPGDTSTFTFKYTSSDPYSQQMYTTTAQTTLATTVFSKMVVGYVDNLSTTPKNINYYDTYYVIVVDSTSFRLASNYADAMAVIPVYLPIEPAMFPEMLNVYVGLTAPKFNSTRTSLIVDQIALSTENPLGLSLAWDYTLGTTTASTSNIDGFIVYVGISNNVGSDLVNDLTYLVSYEDYYAIGKYGIVINNLPSNYLYVAVAAYRYRNNYDYRHGAVISSDGQEFQRSTLLKSSTTFPTYANATTLTLPDAAGTTKYTTVKKYFIPDYRLTYNLSQGYDTATSTMYIDGINGTLSLTKSGIAKTKPEFTVEGVNYDYIPYISTSGDYKYISSKETINYTSNTILPYRTPKTFSGSSTNKG